MLNRVAFRQAVKAARVSLILGYVCPACIALAIGTAVSVHVLSSCLLRAGGVGQAHR